MSNLHEEPTKEYPGLVNMGMTCYMNSYLQTLFHIKMFVREIMQVAPSHQADAEPADEGPINGLKCLFYDMLTSKGHIQTANLTRSFGWESRDVFTQQDVQEFSCILLDVIEKKVEAPNKPNFIKELFCGKLINYIKCTRVNFISEREETFYDIQLPVKGFKNIYESLRDYTLEEVLAGENKYDTETYGKQEAKKGIKFRSLPKLLFFHLRRFEYDIQQDQNVKVGRGDQILQNYQFDDEIDMGAYLEDAKDKPAASEYCLLAVMVHMGTKSNSGHYIAFIRPEFKDWYKFDDEQISKVSKEYVENMSFGKEYCKTYLDINSSLA